MTSYVRQVGGRTTSIVNKAYRGCDRGRTISIAAQLRQTLVNSPPTLGLELGKAGVLVLALLVVNTRLMYVGY